jgi:hypothetical protein
MSHEIMPGMTGALRGGHGQVNPFEIVKEMVSEG